MFRRLFSSLLVGSIVAEAFAVIDSRAKFAVGLQSQLHDMCVDQPETIHLFAAGIYFVWRES